MRPGRRAALFDDRRDAGRRLAERLQESRDARPVVVLGLPRGGVIVAAEVARALAAPLDVIVVRKLGVPAQPELAMGAIGEDGAVVLDSGIIERFRIAPAAITAVVERERAELQRRVALYRAHGPRVTTAGRAVVVVDDGVATGATARAACVVARAQGATRVVLAVPVAPRDWLMRMGAAADAYIAVATPEPFRAVGQFYERFGDVDDADVVACLA